MVQRGIEAREVINLYTVGCFAVNEKLKLAVKSAAVSRKSLSNAVGLWQ